MTLTLWHGLDLYIPAKREKETRISWGKMRTNMVKKNVG
jgi:hypothetical protein